MNKVDIRKIVISNRDSYDKKGSFKYFIEYMSNSDVVPLCIKLFQSNGYVKYFDNSNQCMNLVYNEKLLKAYNEIWDKISNLLEKGVDSEPVFNNKFIIAKIKSYNNEMNTSFQSNKIPEEGVCCVIFF